jgi:hypothetical protein
VVAVAVAVVAVAVAVAVAAAVVVGDLAAADAVALRDGIRFVVDEPSRGPYSSRVIQTPLSIFH